MSRKTILGKYLSYKPSNGPLIDGTVILYILSTQVLTKAQMAMYAKIDDTNRHYGKVMGPVGTDRVVLDRGNGHYWIAPLHIFKNGDVE